MPTPYVSPLVPALPEDLKARYDGIVNIGVVCVLLKLARSVSPHFWLNVNDPGIEIPGIIEFSNLRPAGETVVYVPFYMRSAERREGNEGVSTYRSGWSPSH